jgi:hypothetical protein
MPIFLDGFTITLHQQVGHHDTVLNAEVGYGVQKVVMVTLVHSKASYEENTLSLICYCNELMFDMLLQSLTLKSRGHT